jgi:predicted nucleic acid-binding protein
MPFVIDASITASWVFIENDPRAKVAFERLLVESATAPSLWWYKVRNLLITRERSQHRNSANTAAFLALLATLPIRLDASPDEDALLQLARRHNLTVYDAAYLELAQRHGAELATLDTDLIRAARAESVVLIEKKDRRKER